MKLFKSLMLACLLFVAGISKATPPLPDEGMWLPLLLKDLNYAEMQRLGCSLTAEQIYSVNNSSLKDAIVSLGGFCTAEVVSSQGLLLTNHHCAYDAIQSHSSVENNYLKDGYWAATLQDELPVAGLTVSFLVRMEDVTARINGAAADYAPDEQGMAIEEAIAQIQAEAEEDGRYTSEVKPMFAGNVYYLWVYEIYTDVRLVGAPPSSVGKFGGDTDNWMWPRHTGDFSMLRIYADTDNNPAEYSESNVPYKPKHFLPVSNKGLTDGDFTMVMGYPGSTDRYLTSYGVDHHQNVEAPIMIKVFKKRLAVMKAEMDKSEAVNIALASDYASLANACKYYEGQTLGLNKFNLIADKTAEEKSFMTWVKADAARKKKYGNVLSDIKATYGTQKQAGKTNAYLNLAGFGPGFISPGIQVWRLKRTMETASSSADYQPAVDALKEGAGAMFEDYFKNVDQKVFAATTLLMYEGLPEGQRPDFYTSALFLKMKGATMEEKCNAYAAVVFKKSIVVDKNKLNKFLKKPKLKVLDKDPGVAYITSLIGFYRTTMMSSMTFENNLETQRKVLLEGLMEQNKGKSMYPDANSTMRLTYGTVKTYDSWEGKRYNTFTYANEILDKYQPGDDEFDVPEKLRTLIQNKDFGPYGKDGVLPVCFLHDTDITGGNSGSPVINADGHLVGIAFDGNWESMISDLRFQDKYVRTISVDIRYVLFIIDKYAGAKRLIEEMELVN